MNPSSSAKARPKAKKMTTMDEMPKHVEYDLADATFDDSCIELDDTIEKDLAPASTALPVSSAISSAVSILEEVLEMSGIPNNSLDISLTDPGLPALDGYQPSPRLPSFPLTANRPLYVRNPPSRTIKFILFYIRLFSCHA